MEKTHLNASVHLKKRIFSWISQSHLDLFFDLVSKKTGYYLVYKTLSVNHLSENQWVFENEFKDTAIILQGPIPNDCTFLLNTLEHYLNTFPNVEIVISSWQESNSRKFLEKYSPLIDANKSRLHILLNEKPKNPGISNVNLQIASTLSALRFVENLGKTYVLKSRVDQILTNPLCISILRTKLLSSSLGENTDQKIVIGSRNTFLFRPYSFSDMLQFSSTQVLMNFWSTNLDQRSPLNFVPAQNSTPMEWSKQNMVEVYLVRNYLIKSGFEPRFDFLSHLNALTSFFAVVDSESLGFYWNKYTHNQSSWMRPGFPYPTYEVTEHNCDNPEIFYRNLEKFSSYCNFPWK